METINNINSLIINYTNSINKPEQLNAISDFLENHNEIIEKVSGLFFKYISSEETETTDKIGINRLLDKLNNLRTDIEIIKSIKNNNLSNLNSLLKNYTGKLEEIEIDGIPIIHYAIYMDPKMAELLVHKAASLGGSLDTQDYAGNTPLMLALSIEVDLAHLLIKLGADPTIKNNKSMSPIFLCASLNRIDEITLMVANKKLELDNSDILIICINQKNYRILNLLVKNTNCLNLKSRVEMTPIYYATSIEDHQAMKILLSNGADPAIRCKNQTTFDKAIESSKNLDTIEILLTGSILTESENVIIYKNIEHLKLKQPHGYKEKLSIIEKVHPLAVSAYNEIFSRKVVAHASSLAGRSNLKRKETEILDTTLPLEGHRGSKPFYRITSQLLDANIDKNAPVSPAKLMHYSTTLKHAAEPDREKQLEMIKNGEDVIIYSGFNGHAISLLISAPDKNSSVRHLTICNRGAGMIRTPIELYKFEVGKIGSDFFEENSKAKNADQKHYNQIFLPLIAKKLELKRGDFEVELSNLCQIDKQTVGNCTLANVEGALLALMIYDTVRSELGFGELQNKGVNRLREINKYFNGLIISSQIDYLDKYVQSHIKSKGNEYEIDHLLVQNTLSNFYCLRNVYQNNMEKIDLIETLYKSLLSKSDQISIFKSNKIFFTTEQEMIEFENKLQKNKYSIEIKDLIHDTIFFYETMVATYKNYSVPSKFLNSLDKETRELLTEIKNIPDFYFQKKAIKKARESLQNLNNQCKESIGILAK